MKARRQGARGVYPGLAIRVPVEQVYFHSTGKFQLTAVYVQV